MCIGFQLIMSVKVFFVPIVALWKARKMRKKVRKKGKKKFFQAMIGRDSKFKGFAWGYNKFELAVHVHELKKKGLKPYGYKFCSVE